MALDFAVAYAAMACQSNTDKVDLFFVPPVTRRGPTSRCHARHAEETAWPSSAIRCVCAIIGWVTSVHTEQDWSNDIGRCRNRRTAREQLSARRPRKHIQEFATTSCERTTESSRDWTRRLLRSGRIFF
jgi:hypothetical protein